MVMTEHTEIRAIYREKHNDANYYIIYRVEIFLGKGTVKNWPVFTIYVLLIVKQRSKKIMLK